MSSWCVQARWSEWRRSETTPSSTSPREKTLSPPWTLSMERSDWSENTNTFWLLGQKHYGCVTAYKVVQVSANISGCTVPLNFVLIPPAGGWLSYRGDSGQAGRQRQLRPLHQRHRRTGRISAADRLHCLHSGTGTSPAGDRPRPRISDVQERRYRFKSRSHSCPLGLYDL